MGIIATKKDDTLYSYFLKFEAINYWIFTLYVYGLKWGYVWHDAGPVFGLPIKQNGYLNMILFVYHGVGYYLWKASNDIDKYKEVLSMNTTCLIGLHHRASAGRPQRTCRRCPCPQAYHRPPDPRGRTGHISSVFLRRRAPRRPPGSS